MDRERVGLDTLTRPERSALRELLIRATAAAGRSSDQYELEQLVAAAPIGGLPAAAGLHRVAGSVLRGLDGVGGVPGDVRTQLAVLRQRAALNHLLLTGVLGELGRALDDAGLSWVAMKGPVVAARLYPEVGDRAYTDLDLLVGRRDFSAAMHLLEELGYEHTIHNWALAEQMLAGQIGMKSATAQIDLHWHLHYSHQDRRPFAIDPEAMIERKRLVTVSGVTTPTLDPVDTLLTLAFHAARSDGHRLVWFKDIERAIAVERPDLDELVRRCRAYRCAPPVGLILGRARTLLDADVPDEILRSLTPVTLELTDRVAFAIAHPVRLDERATITRAYTRSVRSSVMASVAAVPTRGARQLRRHLHPPPVNETDSPDEKECYLNAVAASTRP